MPTIYTGSYKIPFEAGKGLGQISAEKESYTRGVEQARLDIQRQQIAEQRKMREIARIDADEKEKRRQLEWDAIAKRSAEAVEESKRRFDVTQEGIESRFERSREITPYQEQVFELAEQERQRKADIQKRNEEMIRRISQGETAPTATQPSEEEQWEANVRSWGHQQEREAFRKKYPEATMTKEAPQPTPIQKSLQDQYIEGIQKTITPIDNDLKRRLRVKSVNDVYNPKVSASQNEMRIKSRYNDLLKAQKEKNVEANLKLIAVKSKIEVARQKPSFEQQTRTKGRIKAEQGIIDSFEGSLKKPIGILEESEAEEFTKAKKNKLSYALRKYNEIRKRQGQSELEFVEIETWGKNKWRLQKKAIAQKVGEIVIKDRRKWKIVGFDVDGEPMVDLVE